MKSSAGGLEPLYNELKGLLSPKAQELAPSLLAFKNSALGGGLSLTRVVPHATKSLSLTGVECEQNCVHCNGHYLKSMGTLEDLQNLEEFKSVLISGGGDKLGAVPIKSHLQQLESLDKVLNLHPGFQSPENIKSLAPKSTVSFDLPSCETVIHEVYGLNHRLKDYRDLYLKYIEIFDTVAHLTIGLAPVSAGSEGLAGELATIDFLKAHPPRELVLIVFRPTQGTQMSNVPAPSINHVIKVLIYALRELGCPVSLGCMRPSGSYRRDLDILFWLHGVKKIVLPNSKLLRTLQKHKITIKEFNQCCGLEGGNIKMEKL
jgi:uncharacterized radical SAM superfamily protein